MVFTRKDRDFHGRAVSLPEGKTPGNKKEELINFPSTFLYQMKVLKLILLVNKGGERTQLRRDQVKPYYHR